MLVAALTVSSVLSATTLKISHQFPAEVDFRDRLVHQFAQKVEEKTHGQLKFEIYPNGSLMKTDAQISAVRKGALDLSLVPISYAGGEMPETSIGLMPGLVTSYAQGYAWVDAPVGKEFAKYLSDKGIILVTWIWQGGGMASRTPKPIVVPADAKDVKIRGGSFHMDMLLKAAGAAVVSIPSDQIYSSMQTGAIDAALTSSTSLASFRLEELAKSLTSARDKTYWFMLEPLIMSKHVFDKLPKDQQEAILSVGKEMQAYALEQCKLDDVKTAEIFKKAGATVADMSAADVALWVEIARRTAWKDYASRSATSAKLLNLAEQVK